MESMNIVRMFLQAWNFQNSMLESQTVWRVVSLYLAKEGEMRETKFEKIKTPGFMTGGYL